MNFKRKRPKSTRAGCLMCKPWKRQGTCLHERSRMSDRRRMAAASEQIKSVAPGFNCY